MIKTCIKSVFVTMAVAVSGMAFVTTATAETEEFGEFVPIVEINATDGDVGFHVLVDGDGWKRLYVYDPKGDRILRAKPRDDLRKQGITEFFIESAEPACWFDEEDEEADPDEVQTVAEFVERFEAGTYLATGRTIDGDKLESEAELTHNLPAAPIVEVDIADDGEITISWSTGVDLGKCEVPDSIPDPAGVEVIRWEIAIEPNEDAFEDEELPDGVVFAELTMQLPGDITSLVVPPEYIDAYIAAGVVEFKGEVGAREESGNQTFTEFFFPDEGDDEG